MHRCHSGHYAFTKISMDLNVHERMHLLLPNILHVCKVIDIYHDINFILNETA